jgi:hypothetical protein
MATFPGLQKPTNLIVVEGNPLKQELKHDATVTYAYPGRLVKKGTTDADISAGDAFGCIGWLGYEQTNPKYIPATVDTAFASGDMCPVLYGGNSVIVGSLAKGCSVNKGDCVANWLGGQVVGPVAPMGEGLALGIPFGASDATETTTYIELPEDMAVIRAFLDVTAIDADETIDVGILSSEAGGDPNGFIAAASVATAGKVFPLPVMTVGGTETYYSSCTIGELLCKFLAGDNVATDVGSFAPMIHVCDGTAKTVTYTGSGGSDTAAGIIWLTLLAEGFEIVGKAEETVDASSAAADIMIRSRI